VTARAIAVDVVAEDCSSLAAYASVSIAFTVDEIVDLESLAIGSGRVGARVNPAPYIKDYDAYPANGPADWPARFDVASWGLFGGFIGGKWVGGAVVAARDRAVDLLEGRDDVAVLWDLRVDLASRRRGVGGALLLAVDQWARRQAISVLKVETQDVNVPACRFYAKHGFTLDAVNRAAYEAFPNEVQLLWSKRLSGWPP
jgi:GNAT superfamily N-acetyltransferase